MISINDKTFEKLVAEGIDAIPERYGQHIDNLAFVVEDEPSPQQRTKLGLRCDESLYGLYEGIPLTRRGSGYNLVLPDKVTIFKKPIEWSSETLEEAARQVKHTIWHEVAHYFGLNHGQIHALERKGRAGGRV